MWKVFSAAFALTATPALALGISAYIGASDPYYLAVGFGEPNNTINAPPGYADAAGRVYVAPPFTPPITLLITVGQSLIASSSAGTFTPVNPTTLNFSIYDRAIYKCANPVLGASPNTASLGTNSPNCQIADSLVTAGTYATAIAAPIAIGGTLCSDWVGGMLQQRIVVLMNALRARNLTAATGFTGQTWVLWHQGENDNSAGTPRAVLAQCIRDFDGLFVTNGLGAHRFFVAKESMVGGVTSSIVTNAEADAVASGCSNCRTGADWDSLTGANRQPDLTHLTLTGAANAAALDVTVITNCKNTSCLRRRRLTTSARGKIPRLRRRSSGGIPNDRRVRAAA